MKNFENRSTGITVDNSKKRIEVRSEVFDSDPLYNEVTLDTAFANEIRNSLKIA